MKIKSGLMILLLCVFIWVGQSPVWAFVSQAQEFTVQNPYMAPATPINFRLELSDAQMAMRPEMLADLNAMIASPPNIDPSIWGKNDLNDFVLITGMVSLIFYYSVLAWIALSGGVFGNSGVNIILPFIILALIPTLPSLPYVITGKHEEGFSHFLSTGFFALVPLILGVVLSWLNPSNWNFILGISSLAAAVLYIGIVI